MTKSAAQWGERALLKALLEVMGRDSSDVVIGPGDDAALIATTPTTVVTVDSIVAGQDWLIDQTPPAAIGHRAAAVNLSDIAAMGGQPRWAVLALELNENDDVDDILQSAAEMARQLALHGATVVGGDLGIGPGPQRWTLTLMATPGPRTLTMSQAIAGYRVWLIGDVGRAAIGLNALMAGDSSTEMAELVQTHLRPNALVDAGQRLAELPHDIAATDISDGLWIDAIRLAEQSAVGLDLHLARPRWLTPSIVEQVRRYGLDWREVLVTGGDDYALLVCSPWSVDLRQELSSLSPLSIEPIGQVVQGDLVSIAVEGERLTGAPRGHEHGR